MAACLSVEYSTLFANYVERGGGAVLFTQLAQDYAAACLVFAPFQPWLADTSVTPPAAVDSTAATDLIRLLPNSPLLAGVSITSVPSPTSLYPLILQAKTSVVAEVHVPAEGGITVNLPWLAELKQSATSGRVVQFAQYPVDDQLVRNAVHRVYRCTSLLTA